MSKWFVVVAMVGAVVAAGCSRQKPQRRSILDTPQPGEEIEQEPETFSPEDHFDLGMLYYSGGKFKEAEAQFMMALRDRPDYPDAHTGLGYVYHFRAFMEIQSDKAKEAIDLHEKAVGHFLKALEKDPKKVEAYIGLSMVNFDEWQYFVPHKDEYRIRALGYLDKAKVAAPNNPNVHANLAFHEAKLMLSMANQAREKESASRAAIPLLRRAVECEGVDPMTRVQAHHMLAGCLYLVGDKEGAIEHYRKYLELFPGAQDADEVNGTIADIQSQLP